MATDGSDIVSTVNTSGHDLPGDLLRVVVAAQEHDLPVQHGRGVADPPLPGKDEKMTALQTGVRLNHFAQYCSTDRTVSMALIMVFACYCIVLLASHSVLITSTVAEPAWL